MDSKMNKRIQELAAEAFESINYPFKQEINMPDILVEKFAELMAKEFVELMKKESEDYSNIGSEYCDHKAEAFDEAADLVKKHLGVTE